MRIDNAADPFPAPSSIRGLEEDAQAATAVDYGRSRGIESYSRNSSGSSRQAGVHSPPTAAPGSSAGHDENRNCQAVETSGVISQLSHTGLRSTLYCSRAMKTFP